MKLKHITDIFFDLDHTLWDFDKNSALTFEKIFKMNQVDVDLNEFLSHYEPINMIYWKRFREEQVDKVTLRYGRLSDTFSKINFTANDTLINQLSEDYIDNLSTFNHLFVGALEILNYLMPKYKLHIITNGFKEVQEGKLNNSNIGHYFDTVTNSEVVGVKKPNPIVFNHAIQLAKTNIEQSIMIGDNYEADTLGALNAGLDAIHFNFHNEDIDKNIKQVSNLKDLKMYL